MQILGIFGFEVLDEGLLPLPRQLGGASIGLALETFLALLFVLFRIFVHVREGHWEGHWSLSSWYSAPASAATLPDSTPLLAAVLLPTALRALKKVGLLERRCVASTTRLWLVSRPRAPRLLPSAARR